jgi:hypothetical protein
MFSIGTLCFFQMYLNVVMRYFITTQSVSIYFERTSSINGSILYVIHQLSRVKDGDQIVVLRNLPKIRKRFYHPETWICLIKFKRVSIPTLCSLDHLDTKDRFCYSEKHLKYRSRIRIRKGLHKCIASHRFDLLKSLITT